MKMKMKICDYYLNLKKLESLEDTSERSQIHRYYNNMIEYYYDNKLDAASSIINTLMIGGYLMVNDVQLESDEDDKVKMILS
jgi:hypothetical protein